MFTDEFLSGLPDDSFLAQKRLIDAYKTRHSAIPSAKEIQYYSEYVDAYYAFQAFCEANKITYKFFELGDDRVKNLGAIKLLFEVVDEDTDKRIIELSHSQSKERFRAKFGVVFSYEFSDGDLRRIQDLLNELRDNIAKSELFDAKHKERLLRRFENLQQELHKKVGSLDKFWGLVGEAGVALGKFGVDAKPFVDRVKEISSIVWRTQARAEELPSDTQLPLLAIEKTGQLSKKD